MRAFVVACLLAVVSAQYHYGPVNSALEINNSAGLLSSSLDDELSLSVQPETVLDEFNKSFYTYSAPEQEFEDLNAVEHIASTLKRNLRVLFIKGPENKGLENAALQLAKASSDDRTAIYVLNKQSDIGNLAQQLQQLKSTNQQKPEVHFVKYRTQADAENAQRTIQAQYDTLPGTSTSNSASSAPVLDFASKSSAASANNAGIVAPAVSVPATPARSYIPPRSAYLPPSRRH